MGVDTENPIRRGGGSEALRYVGDHKQLLEVQDADDGLAGLHVDVIVRVALRHEGIERGEYARVSQRFLCRFQRHLPQIALSAGVVHQRT